MNGKKYQLGIIGLGHMGLALAKGCINGGLLTNKDIAVLAHSPRTKTRCEKEGFFMANTTRDLAQNSRVLLLAVPPKNLDEVLEQLGALAAADKPSPFQILSVVAGRSIKSIQDKLNVCTAQAKNTAGAASATQMAQIPVARAMPNATLQVGLGACAIAFSKEFDKQEAEFIKQIFGCAGIVYELSEELINASVAAHGSTPAYVYYFANCMIEHLKTCGFEEKCARDLLVQTIAGSAKLMQKSPDKNIDLFIDEIATQGGTTAAAIDVLKNSSFAQDLAKANDACIKRCNELAK